MIINGKEEELELEYPCNWQYKLMVHSDSDIHSITQEILVNRECTISKGNSSKTGKYQSYNIELLVHNDDDRHELFAQFKQHTHIKMVL